MLLADFYSSFYPLNTFSFIFSCYGDHRDLHSFPTRRSSDLVDRRARDLRLDQVTAFWPIDSSRETRMLFRVCRARPRVMKTSRVRRSSSGQAPSARGG